MASNRIIDKSMIEEFGSQIDSTNFRHAIYTLSDIIEDAALELSESNNLINIQNIDITPISDVFNTEILNADLNLFLTIKSAQIDLNSVGPMEKKSRIILDKIINAWRNRKANTRRAKKRAAKLKKQKAKSLTIEDLNKIKEEPYTIVSFKDDIFNKLIESLTEMTIIYNYPLKIRILGKEEFGCRINLSPVIKHDDGFKVWDSAKNKFVFVKSEEAKTLLKEKNKEINNENSKFGQLINEDYFYSIIRIFKNIYYTIYKSYDYNFIESLIYNCPNSLFISKTNESFYNVFIKVLNYLANSNVNNYRSIYNQDKLMIEQDKVSIFNIKNFLKDINKYMI